MIERVRGNLLDADVDALVNPVNSDLLDEAKKLEVEGAKRGSPELMGQAIDKLDECVELDGDSTPAQEARELTGRLEPAIARLTTRAEARRKPPRCPVHFNTEMVLGSGRNGEYWHCKLYPRKCPHTADLDG